MGWARAETWGKICGALAALALVAACAEDVVQTTPPVPVQKPRSRVLPPPPSVPAVPRVQPTSEKSATLRSYLAQVQASQLTAGLLRQDGGGPDTPFTGDMLARNFEQIVFFNEYSSSALRAGVSGQLRRWSAPVRMGLVFGPSVPLSQRTRDSADVTAYAARLARVSGHPVSVADPPNFLVFFVNEDERATMVDRIAPQLPGVTPANLSALRALPDDAYCAVAAYAAGTDPTTYTAAVAVIRSENPDLLRLSCIHEELAQGLGLANDSPRARPSIFNDDDEFALLTNHDELLLGMLYDDQFSTGVTLEVARPVVRSLARLRTDGPR